MALSPKISATELKNSFVVYDCTGQYSSDNKGGYGIQNPRMEDVTDAYLEITNPSGDTFKITVYPDMPNVEGLGFEVLPNKVGMTKNEIESGEWKIKYVVSGTDKKGIAFTKSAYMSIVFVVAVQCCVDKMNVYPGPDFMKKEKEKKKVELSNLLESVCYQIEQGLNGKANETIEYVKQQCQCSGC